MLADIVRPRFERPAFERGALKDRVAVVTGANSGIGLATARALAAAGARVVLACRHEGRAEAAKKQIEREVAGAAVEVELMDASSLSSVRASARALGARHPRIHVLVNNAGVWSYYRRESADGIEMTWATNMLGAFAFTSLLLPQLRAAGDARIVTVASGLARSLDLADVEFRDRPYSGLDAYAQSKQANRMWTWALARRLAKSGVTANAVHPGFVKTGAFGKGGGWQSAVADLGARIFGASPEQGADSVVWLAASSEAASMSGRYLQNRREQPCSHRNEANEERLYALCAEMTGLKSDGLRRVA